MRWLAKKSVAFSVAVGLAALLLIASGIILSYQATLNGARRDVESVAGAAADHVYRVLWQAEGALAAVSYQARRGCTEKLVLAFRSAAAANPILRNINYVTPDNQIACNAFGVINPPVPVDKIDFIKPVGSVIWFSRPFETPVTPGRSIVSAHRLKGGGAVQAVFASELLAAPLDRDDLRDVVRGIIAIQGTVLVSRGMADDGSNGFIRSMVDVGLFEATVSVAAPKAFFFRDWERGAVVFGGVGIILMAGACAGIWQWSERQSPIQAELAYALRHHQLDVHYQPVIDLRQNRCIGAEALIRWHHPVRGMVRPDEFIPTAEETGLIIPMTRWLMRRLCEQAGSLLQADPDFHIAINLSPPHFQSLEVVEDAKTILAQYGISPVQILFEITERGLVDDSGCRAVIEGFAEIGSEVAVDDFGTGYSSLAYIQNFKLDYLKIDQAFVKAIGTGAATAGLAGIIIDMAKTLNLRVIAEGVETQAQVDFLKARRVETAQGWYYSKPLELGAFRGFVASFNGAQEGLVETPPVLRRRQRSASSG